MQEASASHILPFPICGKLPEQLEDARAQAIPVLIGVLKESTPRIVSVALHTRFMVDELNEIKCIGCVFASGFDAASWEVR